MAPPASKSGLATGLNKGHIVTKRELPARSSSTKGKLGKRTSFVRKLVGFAPYEKRITELLKVGKDNHAIQRKVAKRKLGMHLHAKKKREEMSSALCKMRSHERPWLFLMSRFKNYLGLVTTTRSQQVSSFPSQQPPVGESQKALKVSLASLLRSSCGTRTTVTVAHHHIIRSGHDGSPFLANLLIGLYGKYGSLQEACSVFDSLQQKNVFSWTMIIDVHAQHGQAKKSLIFYQRMLKEDVKPDRVLFLCVLGVCSNLKDLAYGTQVHAAIARVGFDVDVVVRTALVNMYGKCGSLGNATLVFNSSEERDAILCNAIMTAYNQHGHAEETFQVHEQMQLEGLKPNESTFVTVLGACGILASVLHTKVVHVCLIHCGYESHVVVGTTLINTYNKCGSLEDAGKVFESIPQGDTILCNTMIVAFTQHGQYKDALSLYQRMQKQGLKPSQVTFVCSLCAVTEPSSLPQGKEIHTGVIEHGYESNAFVVTALISMYAKCGSLEDAQEVFERVPLQNVASWTAIIAAYAQYGHTQETFQLYQQMLAEGIYSDKCTISTILAACFSPAALEDGKRIHARMVDSGFEHDVELQTSLISMYGKCGSVKAAAMVFDKKHVQNVGLWNTMLAAYIQHGDAKEAMQLYQCMRNKDLKPDKVTFSTILSACSVLTDLPTGKEIHASIRNAGLQSDVVVGTALVNMYAKCGSLADARRVFDQLYARNAISWNAMIVGHAQTGQAKESVALFEEMRLEGFKTNEITFTNLLYACSHAGLVEEALRFFRIMDEECKITPTLEHYACIIDLLGRVGRLDDAESFIKRYPFQSDSVMWMSLLGACRVHGDIERGRRAADCIFQLDPEKTGPYVLMSNISAAEKS